MRGVHELGCTCSPHLCFGERRCNFEVDVEHGEQVAEVGLAAQRRWTAAWPVVRVRRIVEEACRRRGTARPDEDTPVAPELYTCIHASRRGGRSMGGSRLSGLRRRGLAGCVS